jgi:hypothetical protein
MSLNYSFVRGCLVDLIGIEPMTSSMPWKRAPSCATGPLDPFSGRGGFPSMFAGTNTSLTVSNNQRASTRAAGGVMVRSGCWPNLQLET